MDDKKKEDDIKATNSVEDEIKEQVSRREFFKSMGKWSGVIGTLFGAAGVAATSPFLAGCYSYSNGYSNYYGDSYGNYYGDSGYSYYHIVYYYHRANDKPETLERKENVPQKTEERGSRYCNYFDYADSM